MKISTLFTALLLGIVTTVNAQMDDRFYQPSQSMNVLDLGGKTEMVKLPVDQDTITAYVVKPEVKTIKKTIVFFHGAAGNVSTYQYIVHPLVKAGYQVVAVDVRGYGKSTGKPTHTNVAEDGQKMLDLVMQRSDVKDTKVYLYGASLGSQVATHLAAKNKAKLSGLIIDGGMASFGDIAAVFAPQYKDYIFQMLAGVYSAKQDVANTAGLPKLLIYSKKDSVVPFAQGEELYKAASEPKTFLEFNSEHIQGLKDETKLVLNAIEKL